LRRYAKGKGKEVVTIDDSDDDEATAIAAVAAAAAPSGGNSWMAELAREREARAAAGGRGLHSSTFQLDQSRFSAPERLTPTSRSHRKCLL